MNLLKTKHLVPFFLGPPDSKEDSKLNNEKAQLNRWAFSLKTGPYRATCKTLIIVRATFSLSQPISHKASLSSFATHPFQNKSPELFWRR